MKNGTKYLKVDPWKIIEEGFHKNRSQVSESVFSLANEYQGTRGFFEEKYSGDQLKDFFVNGIYEYDIKPKPQYKGITDHTNFMLNCDNWLTCRIIVDDEELDLNKCNVSNFLRILDMKTGKMIRKFDWHLSNGNVVKLSFTRLLSNVDEHFAFQYVTIQAKQKCNLLFFSGIDFNTRHENYKNSFWQFKRNSIDNDSLGIVCNTISTKQNLAAAFKYKIRTKNDYQVVSDDHTKYIGIKITSKLSPDTPFQFNKAVCHKKTDDIQVLVKDLNDNQTDFSEENQTKLQKKFWNKIWNKYDIIIKGDAENQQGIRFCIFQLLQTYRGLNKKDNIGAKGLTGEVYNGHCYWETETIVFPFYLFTNSEIAKQLLNYRYNTLPQAKDRAKMVDCKGASYPLATLNGEEGNDYWQHANTQLQPSTAVAYAIWHYTNVVKNKDFLYKKGIEMLVEISRFLYSRGDYGQTSGKFGFYGVMGPDEFQMMVNNDAYTNLMGKFTFEFTITAFKDLKKHQSDQYHNLIKKVNLKPDEIKNWKKASDNMKVNKSPKGVIEQQDGFFDLPHINITKISQNEYPLYDHWSYDRLFRNDMIKQPDVLMFQFLFDSHFSEKEKLVNFNYYNPRTVHESSLSPSIHSVLAEELGKNKEAYNLFRFATRLDLDDYNNNTSAGLHMTSIAAAWLNIVYGFGGLRSDNNQLSLAPKCPGEWQELEFNINYLGAKINIRCNHQNTKILMNGKPNQKIILYGKEIMLKEGQEYISSQESVYNYD